MAKKSYAIMNLSYRDETRTGDYLLERVEGKDTFNMPATMGESNFMYAGELTEMICQDALRELETDRYTSQEIDNKLQDLSFEILSLLKKED